MRRFDILALTYISSAFCSPIIPVTLPHEPSAWAPEDVNMSSGGFRVAPIDLVTKGVQPIKVQRGYESNLYSTNFNAQCPLEEEVLFVRVTKKRKEAIFGLYDASGGRTGWRVPERWGFHKDCVREWTMTPFVPYWQTNATSGELGARSRFDLMEMDYCYYDYTFTLRKPNGERRVYSCFDRKSEDLKKKIAKKKNKNHLIENFVLSDVMLSNGNRLHYEYDKHRRVRSIQALNSTEENVLGWVDFSYEGDEICVSSSDNRSVVYRGNEIVHPDGSVEQIISSREKIDFLIDGQLDRRVNYDELGRVKNIVGEALSQFSFDCGEWTSCHEQAGVSTYYSFDEWARLSRVATRDLDEQLRYETDWYDREYLRYKILRQRDADGKWNQLYERKYSYDNDGNVWAVDLRADLTGEDRTGRRGVGLIDDQRTTYSYDRNHLCTGWSDENTSVKYSYKPGTDLITRQTQDDLCDEEFEYDENAALKTYCYSDDGVTLVTRTEARKEWPAYGLPEDVTEYYVDDGVEMPIRRTHIVYDEHCDVIRKEIFDSEDRLVFVESWDRDAVGRIMAAHGLNDVEYTYDKGGRCIAERQSSGLEIERDFDGRGCLIGLEVNGQKEHYRYNESGHLIAKIDALGRETNFETDIYGHITSTVLPWIRTESGWEQPQSGYQVDAFGNVLCLTNEVGDETRYKYTARGQVSQIAYPDGTTESKLYSLAGHLVEERARSGAVTTYEVDQLGRPLVTSLAGLEERHEYLGRLLKCHSDAAGIETHYEYDGQGRLIRTERDGLGAEITYNSRGLKSSETFSTGHYTSWEYDDHGRVTRRETETGCSTYAYDAAGNLCFQAVHDGTQPLTVETAYDSLSRPIQITDQGGGVTKIKYVDHDTFENQPVRRIETTIPSGNIIIQIADGDGRLLHEERRDMFKRLLREKDVYYDLLGRVTSERHTVHNEEGPVRTFTDSYSYGYGNQLVEHMQSGSIQESTTAHTYDDLGRLETTLPPDGRLIHRVYDDRGQVSRFYGVGFDYQITYDSLGRATDIESPTGTLSRTHTPSGLLASETFPSGATISYEYDALGRVTSLTMPDGSSVDYERDGSVLQLVRRTRADGTTYEHRYLSWDDLGRPVEEELPLNSGCLRRQYDAYGACSVDHEHFSEAVHSRDPLGNPLSTTSTTYEYDALNHLTSDSTHSYTYDSLHNLLGKDDASLEVDGLNRLMSHDYEYDGAGNLISDPSNRYEYDALGRLIYLETPTYIETYTYDIFDRRLSMSRTSLSGDPLYDEEYIYVGMMEVAALTEGELSTLRVLDLDRPSDIGSTLAIELDDATHVPLSDLSGSIRVLLQDGSPHEAYSYTAYGEETTSSHPRNPYRYQSKRTDDSCLVLFGHRYYMPAISRFLTPDPAHDGPNAYAYVGGNPSTHVDHFGLLGESRGGGHELPLRPTNPYPPEVHFNLEVQGQGPSRFQPKERSLPDRPYKPSPPPSNNHGREDMGMMERFVEDNRKFLNRDAPYMGPGHDHDSPDTESVSSARSTPVPTSRPYAAVPPSLDKIRDNKKQRGPSWGLVGTEYPFRQGMRPVYVNGMFNSYEAALAAATQVAHELRNPVYFVYNPTAGLIGDPLSFVLGVFGWRLSASPVLEKLLVWILVTSDPDMQILLLGHSQGGQAIHQGLQSLGRPYTDRIEAYTFGSAKWIRSRIDCHFARNYVSEHDGIPYYANGCFLRVNPQYARMFTTYSNADIKKYNLTICPACDSKSWVGRVWDVLLQRVPSNHPILGDSYWSEHAVQELAKEIVQRFPEYEND
jgi:RHS repeat-associated protein